MNATELKDKAYAEAIAKLQMRRMSWTIGEREYEEAYENARSKWVMEDTKSRTNILISNHSGICQ